jgi:hypothetical protein
MQTLGSRRAPRVLVLLADQWPRALLRAELIEAGYDAVGARTVREGRALLEGGKEQGPVRLVVVDESVLRAGEASLAQLTSLEPGVALLLLAPAAGQIPEGHWTLVLHRPIGIAEIVATVRAMVPQVEEGTGTIE